MPITCKKCLNEYEELIKIDSGMSLRLQEIGHDAHTYGEVCNSCFDLIKHEISQGAKLMAEESQKIQNKQTIWKNRVGFIKDARERMNTRSFSEAAVLYEKYLRALEITHDVSPGKLDPLIFNAPGKSSELTILCTVYWDLFKIYDASDKYIDRQQMVGSKLVSIIPYSSVQGDLVKKAERFVKDARGKDNARKLMIKVREATGQGGCFIATAAYGNYDASTVLTLRDYRDQILSATRIGRLSIRLYYALSPSIARRIAKNEKAKKLCRSVIEPIALLLANKYNLNRPPSS